jgi:hypothetical protein
MNRRIGFTVPFAAGPIRVTRDHASVIEARFSVDIAPGPVTKRRADPYRRKNASPKRHVLG